VRQGLWLQLETARLALLREDDAAYQAALARAAATVDQYFDRDAARVERFAAQLRQLTDVELNVEWPDVSEPWTRLQGIRSVRGSAPMPDAEPAIVPLTTDATAEPVEVDGADETAAGPEEDGVVDAADGGNDNVDGGDGAR
jgi:uncharacterized protein HemX